MSAITSIARMMRPPLGVLTAVGATAALLIISPHRDPFRFVLIAAAVFCVTSGGYLINDVFDVERDRVTHPERPLPSGRVRWTTALMAAVVCLATGIVAALPLGREATLIVAANIGLLVAYSPLKTWSGVLGNILTAYLCASIAILGGVVGGNVQPLLPAIVFVFFANLARETILDLNDAEGDRAAGLRTAPLVFGAEAVFRFTWTILAFLALFLTTLAAFGEVVRPVLFLACLLGSLALFAVGLRRYQEHRDMESFHRFKMFGRWAFALSLPGFLAGGLPLAAQAVPYSAAPPQVPDPPAILAYALAGVGLTFFLIANSLISDYNRESREMWTRIDARWRFYALFTCLNYVFVFQCFSFALGILPDLDRSWWNVFFFVNGFVPFPVIWLELVYTKNSKELGFTRYYEQNCWDSEFFKNYVTKYYTAQEAFRRKERTYSGELVSLFWGFLRAWLLIYLITPLIGFHLRRNRRNPDLGDLRTRQLQTAQDFLVLLTNWLFVLGLFAFGLGIFVPETARLTLQPLAPAVIWLFFFILVSSFVLAVLSWLQATEPSLRNGWPVLLLAIYVAVLSLDLAANDWLWRVPFRHPTLLWPESFGGGLTPWALLGLLIYLIWNFLRQLREARRLSRQWAELADFALHRFGNLLTPPYLALQQVSREFQNPETLARLGNDTSRRNAVLRQVGNATESLTSAREILLDLKSHARRSWKEHWYPISDLLKTFPGTQTYEVDGKRGTLEILIDLGSTPLDLYVDKSAFLDVIENLTENARQAIEKAARGHGEIRIFAEHQPEGFYPLRLSIWDNGTGIPKEVVDRMFDLGFTTRPQGAGIGLFVVWDFVQRIQGDIDVRTEIMGKAYAEFCISFPQERVRVGRLSAQKT